MPLGERFLFDESFDEKDLARAEAEVEAQRVAEETVLIEKEEATPSFTQEELEKARDDGFKAGHEAGLNDAATKAEAQIKDSLSIIGERMEDLLERQALDAADTFTDSVNIAVAIARKCFPALNETNGFQEIERMTQEVLKELLEEPRVIIYVNAIIKDLLETQINAITEKSHFEGQVIILEDEEIQPGDCRITWSSGSAERSLEGTIRKIEQIVEANLEANQEIKEETSKDQGTTIDTNKLSENVVSGQAVAELDTAANADTNTVETDVSSDLNSKSPAPLETNHQTVTSDDPTIAVSPTDDHSFELDEPLPEEQTEANLRNTRPTNNEFTADNSLNDTGLKIDENQNDALPRDPET